MARAVMGVVLQGQLQLRSCPHQHRNVWEQETLDPNAQQHHSLELLLPLVMAMKVRCQCKYQH